MDREWAERIVKDVLKAVHAQPHVGGLLVPHGFTIGAIEAEEKPNTFSGLSGWAVRATLIVPVIYSYTTGHGGHLPADRSNLNELRALIEEGARYAPHRVELDDWRLEPEEDPAPKASRSDPDTNWTVSAEFDVA